MNGMKDFRMTLWDCAYHQWQMTWDGQADLHHTCKKDRGGASETLKRMVSVGIYS